MSRVVIIGAGAAGSSAAARLLKSGFDGEVHLVAKEPESPYYRPAVSKQMLQGLWGLEHAQRSLALDAKVIRHDDLATRLDLDGRTVHLRSGDALPFDRLLLAPGCAPRSFPSLPTGGRIGSLNSYADMEAAREWFQDESLVIVGAGLIGSEAASVATAAGVQTTLLDPSPAPLARALGRPGNELCMQWHRDAGVDLRLGAGVVSLEQGDTGVEAVLDDGSRVRAAHALVCVGVAPETGWLAGSGIEMDATGALVCEDNLLVTGTGGTVAAAGDAASWPSGVIGSRARVEHWSNAIEQGAHAADSLLHGEGHPPFDGVPTFWTEQHGHLVHGIGRPGMASDWKRLDLELPRDGQAWEAVDDDGRTRGYILIDAPQLLGRYRTMMTPGSK